MQLQRIYLFAFVTVLTAHAQHALWLAPPQNSGFNPPVQNIAFTRDGSRVISDDQRFVDVFDAATGARYLRIDKMAELQGQFNDSAQVVAAGASSQIMRIPDPLEISPDNQRLISIRRIWSLQTGERLRVITDGYYRAMTASANWDRYALSSGFNGTSAEIRNFADGKLIHTLSVHDSHSSSAVAFSPDGRLLATVGGEIRPMPFGDTLDRRLTLWDAQNGAMINRLTGQNGSAYMTRFSHDGRFVASISETGNGGGCIWDVASGQLIWSRSSAAAPAVGFAFIPGSGLVAWGNESGIEIWDFRSSNLVATITDEAFRISALAVSPDGRRIAAGRMDGAVAVFGAPIHGQLGIETSDANAGLTLTFRTAANTAYALRSSGDFRLWTTVTNFMTPAFSSEARIRINPANARAFFQLQSEEERSF